MRSRRNSGTWLGWGWYGSAASCFARKRSVSKSKDPSSAPRAIQLLLIARFLERVCDHASYIAEDVVYMVKGRDVRHVTVEEIEREVLE